MKKNILIGGIMAALATATLPCANAIPTLTLTSGSTVTVVDGSGQDTDTDAGVVSWAGTIGSWKVRVASGDTKPDLGTATAPQMDLTSAENQTTAASTLVITFDDTGFVTLGNLLASIGGTLDAGWTLTYSVLKDGVSIASHTYTDSGSGFSGGLTATVGGASPYELTQVITIVAAGKGSDSFDAGLKVSSPDGGTTLVMLGGALVGLAGFRARLAKRA